MMILTILCSYVKNILTHIALLSDKSGAFGLGCSILKEMEEAEKIIVDNNWSRNGLLTHLASQDGHCLLAYEEMDAFFATVVKYVLIYHTSHHCSQA